jgi:hypothetical protein
MRLALLARLDAGFRSGRSDIVLALAGMMGLLPALAFAASETQSIVDRLHFAINETEFTFAEGGPAFVSPATALAGLSPPTIRRAYLTRELDRVEGIVTELAVRHAENPASKHVTGGLAAARGLAARLRADLGIDSNSAPPVPIASVPKDSRVAMTGDDDHMFLRLRPATAAASSVAFQKIDVDGVRGRVVTGTHAIEFQPTAKLTGGLFARSRFGEAWTEDELDHAISAGWGVGAASSFELNRNVTLSAAVLYGRSWNEAAAADSDVSYGGDRLVADARMDGRFWSGSWLFAPALAAHYEQAGRGEFVDSEIGLVAEERHRLGRLSATTELSRSFVKLDGPQIVTVHPFVRTGANVEVQPSENAGSASLSEVIGASALVGGGVRVHFSDKASLMVSEEFEQDEEDGTFRFVAEVETPLGGGPGRHSSTLNLSADADHAGSVSAALHAVVRFH